MKSKQVHVCVESLFYKKSICWIIILRELRTTSNTEAPFLDLNLSISNDIVSTIYDKRDYFDLEIRW